jgi:hypothetical protein
MQADRQDVTTENPRLHNIAHIYERIDHDGFP